MPISAARLFADVQLAWVSTQGFRDVVLCVGFQAAQFGPTSVMARGTGCGCATRRTASSPSGPAER